MRSCANCRPYWRPGPACAPSAAPGSTPTREPRPNEVLLVVNGHPAPERVVVGHAGARGVAVEVRVDVLAVAEDIVELGVTPRVLVVDAAPADPVVVGLVHRAGSGVAPDLSLAEGAVVPEGQPVGDVGAAALPDVEVEVPAHHDGGIGRYPLVHQGRRRPRLGGGSRLG